MDLTKYNLPSLNSKTALDARKGNQYWPRELSHNGKLAVLGCRFVPADGKENKTPKFAARVKVVESDNPNALNREYTLAIPCVIDPKYQHLADGTRAAFFAACVGESSETIEGQVPYDCDKAQQTIVDADEAGDLADGSCVIYHRSISKTKDAFDPKDGKPIKKTNCNHYFSPVTT